MKARKHACFPYSSYFTLSPPPPLYHNGKGSIVNALSAIDIFICLTITSAHMTGVDTPSGAYCANSGGSDPDNLTTLIIMERTIQSD